MRKVILFIASSIDGFIAREDGQIDWLFSDNDYGYAAFYESIDTTLMGHNTYKQALAFDGFPDPNKVNYVFSRSVQANTDVASFITANIPSFVKTLKQQAGKDIWLIGGGQLNAVLLEHGLIDELVLSIHPILLGKGLLLFAGANTEAHFTLVSSRAYDSGLVQLKYQRK